MATFKGFIESMIAANANKIFEAKSYVDDHSGQEYDVPETIGFQIRGMKVTPVAVSKKYSFSVNPYVFDKDGKLHLSTWSCGGTVRNRGDLKSSIRAFNEEHDYLEDNRGWSKEYLILAHKTDHGAEIEY